MTYKGKLKSILKEFDNTVSVLINLDVENVSESLVELQNDIVSVSISKYRKPRSIDANRYYWELLGQLADKLMVSTPYLHNKYLIKCGEIDHSIYERVGEQAVSVYLPDTDRTLKLVEEDTRNHFLPTSQIISGKDGEMLRGYILLKGSHTYNTKQFSRLINFVIEDCKEQGIETLPPREIEQLCKLIKNI